jgi:hypothetical protein
MSRVIAMHAVGNMDTWLAGGNERAEIFKQFCSGYRIFRHPKENKVALVWEDVDLKSLRPRSAILTRNGRRSGIPSSSLSRSTSKSKVVVE